MNNTQQPKPDPKGKAIASFWLGIITVILSLGFSLDFMLDFLSTGYLRASMFYVLPALIIGITGLILGRRGLKSSKRATARNGIILCIIGLIYVIISFPAFLFYLYVIHLYFVGSFLFFLFPH